MFLSPCDLADRAKCRALFKKQLLDLIAHLPNEQPVNEGKGSGSLQRLLRFGQLLGEPMSLVYQDLVINCIEMGYYDRAQEYFQYVCVPHGCGDVCRCRYMMMLVCVIAGNSWYLKLDQYTHLCLSSFPWWGESGGVWLRENHPLVMVQPLSGWWTSLPSQLPVAVQVCWCDVFDLNRPPSILSFFVQSTSHAVQSYTVQVLS